NAFGTLVWSPVAGQMVFAGANSAGPDCSDLPGSQPPHEGLGYYQRISGGGTLHYLGHLRGFLMTGGSVTAGQNVAEMGSTGCSTGSHLHWTIYQNGNLINPALWAGPGP
ncbi:MAG TPA: M23 family metallopeptidase, partial [Anaerolineae bacterium]|nr:M23 family metallopeptidase [Anaerolineae bacterium]